MVLYCQSLEPPVYGSRPYSLLQVGGDATPAGEMPNATHGFSSLILL